jgi:E3 ubiquitin-protein ligase TRIP12
LAVLDKFKFVGKFVAKSLLDSRLLDLPFSPAFLKWMLGKALTLHDLKEIDPDLARSTDKLYQVCVQKRAIEANQQLVRNAKFLMNYRRKIKRSWPLKI